MKAKDLSIDRSFVMKRDNLYCHSEFISESQNLTHKSMSP